MVEHRSKFRLCGFGMRVGLILILIGAPALAQDIGAGTEFSCQGSNPDWTFEAKDDEAEFNFLGTADLIRALTTKAQGADWPLAHTYIGRRGSSIVLLEPTICGDQDFAARVFTQGGETPLLLIGCCTVVR